jgi:hypothetical protein
MTVDEAVKNFPEDAINRFPPNVPYTFWHLLEHIRRTQKDILSYIVSTTYQEMKWPDDYWPKKNEHATPTIWKKTITQFKADLDHLIRIINDPKTDLYAILKNSKKATLFQEIAIIANHNSYHIGEFGILRQVCKTW